MPKGNNSHYKFNNVPISDIQQSLESSDIDCLDLANHCLQQHDKFGKQLNCYHMRDDKQFTKQAKKASETIKAGERKPLTGLPVSIKGNFAVEGLKCYGGTCKQLPQKWQQEGTLVKNLRAQSCPVTGLTHASELAFGGLGINHHWGTPRNPWDANEHRVPGGSSSGAAVSVISGSAVFAVGSDTGGSIRVPASAAGMVGLKTSKGRWPDDGLLPLCKQFDTPGVICRSVADTIDVYTALESKDKCSMCFSKNACYSDFSSYIADESCLTYMEGSLIALFNQVINELGKAGMRSKQTEKPIFARAIDTIGNSPSVAAVECNVFIENELPGWQELLSTSTKAIFKRAQNISAKQYLQRLENLKELQTRATVDMEQIDILISPTLSITPPLLAEMGDEEKASHACSCMLRNTVVANVCGYCAITLPVGLDQFGIPVGLQLMAAKSQEDKLLQFAQLVENTLGNSFERLGVAPMLQ